MEEEIGIASLRRFRRTYWRNVCVLFIITSIIITFVVVNIVEPPREPLGGIFDFQLVDINGAPHDFYFYHHKIIMITTINFDELQTKEQIKGLNELHNRFNKGGLRIVAFSCDQFSEKNTTLAELKEQVKLYNIQFPVMGPIEVNGINQHPIYELLKSHYPEDVEGNFVKFVLDKNGVPRKRYPNTILPHKLSAELAKIMFSA